MRPSARHPRLGSGAAVPRTGHRADTLSGARHRRERVARGLAPSGQGLGWGCARLERHRLNGCVGSPRIDDWPRSDRGEPERPFESVEFELCLVDGRVAWCCLRRVVARLARPSATRERGARGKPLHHDDDSLQLILYAPDARPRRFGSSGRTLRAGQTLRSTDRTGTIPPRPPTMVMIRASSSSNRVQCAHRSCDLSGSGW
jgi:hypothetical protein